jgi:hypothetical protein
LKKGAETGDTGATTAAHLTTPRTNLPARLDRAMIAKSAIRVTTQGRPNFALADGCLKGIDDKAQRIKSREIDIYRNGREGRRFLPRLWPLKTMEHFDDDFESEC